MTDFMFKSCIICHVMQNKRQDKESINLPHYHNELDLGLLLSKLCGHFGLNVCERSAARLVFI